MGVANSNSVHVDIIESGLLHTTLQHQCLSTPSRKVVREIEIDIAIQYPLRLVFVRSDLQLLVGHVSSILHHVLFEEELLCLSGQLMFHSLQLTLQLTTPWWCWVEGGRPAPLPSFTADPV